MEHISADFSGDFERDFGMLTETLKNDAMFRKRVLKIAGKRIAVAFFEGMADAMKVEEFLIKPLITAKDIPETADNGYLCEKVFFASGIEKVFSFSQGISGMQSGDTLIISEFGGAMISDTKGFRARGIEEPGAERVLQGPREGFDEVGNLNVAMIRRKLKTKDLFVEKMKFGRRTETEVYICYLDSLVNKNALDTLKTRLSTVDIDGVLDSNYLTELIRDGKHSLFKTVGATERPDVAAARLLEGRIAVIVDGTPMVLTVPYLFGENFQSDEDYYVNFFVGSIGRFIRYLCFFLSTSIPAIFIALTTYHIGLLPTPFMLSLAELRSGVPFSSVTECLVLIIVFEILREAGTRTPQGLGSALSIVGGLVVGQAAVEAKIISAPMLIAVALAGVAELMIPRLKGAILYLRISFTLAASLMGLVGYMMLASAALVSVLGRSSMGVDYTVTLRNISLSGLKDTLIRAPWTFMKTRPMITKDIIRQRKKYD
ncbi:MAG: spore germination protein [Clostridia bacterium]|nr:spore germination protein [Clostridia bacterium]